MIKKVYEETSELRTVNNSNNTSPQSLHHFNTTSPQSLHPSITTLPESLHHFSNTSLPLHHLNHCITWIITPHQSLHNFNNTSLQHYITSIITPPQSLHHLNTTSPQSLHHFLTCCSSYFCKLVVTPRTAVNQSIVHLVSRQGRFLFRQLRVCSFHVRSSLHCWHCFKVWDMRWTSSCHGVLWGRVGDRRSMVVQ